MGNWDPAKKALYKAKEVEKARAQSLAEVDALLPLPKNATFEELVAISRKVSGNSIAYPKLIKAIKEHPAYKEVIADLISAMNAGPHHDGVTVIADKMTTTNGATSIQGNDQTVAARFLNSNITDVAIIAS